MTHFYPESLAFLADLAENNNREWFAANKSRYTAANNNAKEFLFALEERMNAFDEIQGSKLFRIYRDVRFAKDKSPYNPRFGMSLSRRKPHLRGGYFVDVRPEGATVVAGFWGPVSSDMAIIRAAIAAEGDRFREVATLPQIVDLYGPMVGEGIKTAPRGFKSDHPDIDLLRRKQYLYKRHLPLDETTSEDLLEEVVFSFQAVRPFFNYMSEVLVG